MEEATVLIPAGASLHLALPCHAALLERFTLPSGDPAELTGMAQLQLEKTLPYPLEEVTSDLVVVHQGAEESTVLSIAVHTEVLAQLCAPLREREHLPERISFFALSVAAKASPEGVNFMVWKEQGHITIAIVENGKLSWGQSVTEAETEAFAAELPALLLAAEMNGVPTQFTRALLASDATELTAALTGVIECPLGHFNTAEVRPADAGNLLPADWASEATKQLRSERMRQRLLVAAVVYLLLVAGAFLYLAWNKRQLQVLDAEIARTRPLIEATQLRQQRWQTLAAATDPARYAVEITWLVYKSRPGPELHITQLDYAPTQFMVEGEAPSAAAAIDFAERLRAEPGLSDYRIESGPPQILPNETAQFRIFGKL